MNDAKPTYLSAGINFSGWVRATGLKINFESGTVSYQFEGPHITYSVERPFNPKDTQELRRHFGDEMIDRVVQMWNEYHATRFDESGFQLW